MNPFLLLAFLGTLIALLIYQLRRERLRSLSENSAGLQRIQPSINPTDSVALKEIPGLQLTAIAVSNVQPLASPTPLEPEATSLPQVNPVSAKKKKSSRSQRSVRIPPLKMITETPAMSPPTDKAVLQLLRMPGGLATALVLHEIFASPRAYRRR